MRNKKNKWLKRPCRDMHDVAQVMEEMYKCFETWAEDEMEIGYTIFERNMLQQAACDDARNTENAPDATEPPGNGSVAVYNALGDIEMVTIRRCQGGKLYGWSERLQEETPIAIKDIVFGDALKLVADMKNWDKEKISKNNTQKP